MKYRRTDALYDMQGIRTSNTHFEGAEAVAAAIRSRLLSFQGEWWENLEDGIPFGAMIGRFNTERNQIVDALIRVRVLGTKGVLGITEYETSFVGKQRTVYIGVMTEYGDTSLEVSV